MKRARALAACLALAACKEKTTAVAVDTTTGETAPAVLSINSPTKDEDPTVVLARDGTLFVAWFSVRGGNPDIYIANSRDGKQWSSPVRVTSHTGGDFDPTLIQDENGVFHLTWFRWTALYVGHIMYNTSTDGVTWNQSAEIEATTTANVDDWVPTIAKAADGTVLVYFVSDKRDAGNPTNEIYLAAKRPGQAAFDAAVPVTDVNSATLHDHLPVVARTGSQLTLAWSRYDTQNATPWLNPKSDLYFATSTNGRNWSAPAKVTNDAGNVVHLYAAMYQAFDQQWRMLWLTNRHGATQAIALPVSGASQFPTGLVEDVLPGNGYSHRVAQTTTPGLYLGVWVQGPEGSQDIYYRLFRR